MYNPAYFVSCVCQLLNNLLWEWCLYSILLTEYKRKWRSSVLSKSCNRKWNIHGKSWLFPWGFSLGIQWARHVSQGPEELSLNAWIAFLKLNSYFVKYKSLSLPTVNEAQYRIFGNPLATDFWLHFPYAVAVHHSCKPAFLK